MNLKNWIKERAGRRLVRFETHLGHVEDLKHRHGVDTTSDEYRFIAHGVKRIEYEFKDYDGEIVSAFVHVTNSTYAVGVGLFWWLSLFFPLENVQRLHITVSKDFGPDKYATELLVFMSRNITMEMKPGYSALHRAFRHWTLIEHPSSWGPFKVEYHRKVTKDFLNDYDPELYSSEHPYKAPNGVVLDPMRTGAFMEAAERAGVIG